MIAGHHGQVVTTERDLHKELRRRGITAITQTVDDWDSLAWHKAIRQILDDNARKDIIVNLTAGHGLAQGLLAIHAAKRGLPVACYDWETFAKTGSRPKDLLKYVHYHSPAAILNLDSLHEIDKQILRILLMGKANVMELVGSMHNVPQSTVSTSLARLARGGFVDRTAEGRTRLYAIRPGLESMLSAQLA